MNLDPAEILEYRVANVVFNNGYFARRRVSVSSLFYPDKVDVTDIDVLGIKFDTNFNKYFGVWECKTGQDKPIDTMLWLLGMANYLGASYKCLVRPEMSDKVKAFGKSVGISTWDDRVISPQEKLFADLKLKGYNNAQRYYQKKWENYKIIRTIPKLRRIYWFQNSGFWFETPDGRLKKTITSIIQCQEEIAGIDVRVADIAQELLLEGVIQFSVALLDFAGTLYAWQKDNLKERVAMSLTSGLGSPEERKQIIHAALTYASAIKGVKLPATREPQIDIPPPEYVESLADILERMYERPLTAIDVPRFLELIIYDYILADSKKITKSELEPFFNQDITILSKMAKNVVTFLEREVGFPKEIMELLLKL